MAQIKVSEARSSMEGSRNERMEFRSFAELDRYLCARRRIVQVEGRRYQIPAHICPGTLYQLVIGGRHALVDRPPARAYVEVRDGEEVLIRPMTTYVDETKPTFSDADIYSFFAPVPPELAKRFKVKQPKPQEWVCRRCGYVMAGPKPETCEDCGGAGSRIVTKVRTCEDCGQPVKPRCKRCAACQRKHDSQADRERRHKAKM